MHYYCLELWENVRALLHVIITGCSNCQAGTLVWLGIAIREQWWIGWMLTDVMAGVIVKWDLRFKTKQICLKLHLLLGCVKLKVILPPIFLKKWSENGSCSFLGRGLGVVGFFCSLYSTAVLFWWRKVEPRADTWTGAHWEVLFLGHLPALRFLSKQKKVSKCKFPESSLAWSNTFRWLTICLRAISLSIFPQSVDI